VAEEAFCLKSARGQTNALGGPYLRNHSREYKCILSVILTSDILVPGMCFTNERRQ